MRRPWPSHEEDKVLELIADGLNNQEIASALSVPLSRSDASIWRKASLLRKEHPHLALNQQELDQFRIAAQRDAMLRQQNERLVRLAERQEARYQQLQDTLREAITPLVFKAAWTPKACTKPHAESANLVLSDTHIGKKTTSYSPKKAEASIRSIFEKSFHIADIHRKAYPISELNIFATGDIVDGSEIYPTHAHHADGNMVNQVFGSLPAFTECTAEAAKLFPRVRIFCIRGNHGRVSKSSHEETNWDNLFYKAWEASCANIAHAEFHIPLGWHQVARVQGLNILQFHGHQIKMTFNLPWYGITTRILRWAAAESIKDFDVAVLGHFHTSSYVRWASKRIFSNGTTVDGDEFAKEMIGMESSRTQWLFGVAGKRVTWQYELTA